MCDRSRRGRFPTIGGWTTLAFNRLSGKSFGLRVKIKCARPSAAQRQNASSSGSGEISDNEPTSTSSARSRSRLMRVPIAADRTCRRFSTSLYSARISSV